MTSHLQTGSKSSLNQAISVTPDAQPLIVWVCRDAEVLSLFSALINKLKQRMESEVPQIFEAVFECTLQMITRNFEVSVC